MNSKFKSQNRGIAVTRLLGATGVVALTIVLAGCGKSSGTNTAANPYAQPGVNPYANPYAQNPYAYQQNVGGAYVVQGPNVLNCSTPNEIRLRGRCMSTNSLLDACTAINGTVVNAIAGPSTSPAVPNTQLPGVSAQYCRAERIIVEPKLVRYDISMGAQNVNIGCQSSGPGPLCFQLALWPNEFVVVYGTVLKSSPTVSWSMGLHQNGGAPMTSASGGSTLSSFINPTSSTANGPTDCNRNGRSKDDDCKAAKLAGRTDKFLLRGAPNTLAIGGGAPVNGNPNVIVQGGAIANQPTTPPSQYEVQGTIGQTDGKKFLSTTKVKGGVAAVTCEDGYGRYVACPFTVPANTLP